MPKGVKGNNHNPNGRPKGTLQPQTTVGYKTIADIRAYCKQWTFDAVDVTVKILKDEGATPAARLVAAQMLLDRLETNDKVAVVEYNATVDNLLELMPANIAQPLARIKLQTVIAQGTQTKCAQNIKHFVSCFGGWAIVRSILSRPSFGSVVLYFVPTSFFKDSEPDTVRVCIVHSRNSL